MRITFVIPNDGMTGGIRVVAIYAENLSRRGHQVVVVAPGSRRVRFHTKIRSLIAGRGWPSEPEPEPSYFDGLSVKVRKLESARPITERDVPDADVVVATWWETAEWVAAFPERKGAKIYFIQHHEVFQHLPVERARQTYRLPFKKVVISRWLECIMRDQYGDADVELIPNSVDARLFFSPDRNKQPLPTVGFVYSRVEFKGSDVILNALDKVRQALRGSRVVAFGAEHPSENLPLPDWVEYHYRPSQDRIRELYSQCDVWLCGSRSEGFYLPMLEAMACRCPVVSTRVGGPIDNIVDAENGFLVDVDDSEALAERTLAVLRLSNKEWHKMSLAALSTATRYTWDDAVDKLEHSFRGLSRPTATVPGKSG